MIIAQARTQSDEVVCGVSFLDGYYSEAPQ